MVGAGQRKGDAAAQRALRITAELNDGYRDPAQVRTLLARLWGRPVEGGRAGAAVQAPREGRAAVAGWRHEAQALQLGLVAIDQALQRAR